MKTIIVATDFSPVSLNAVHFAVNMALAVDAELLLFNAYHIPLAYSSDAPLMLLAVEELRKDSETQLAGLKEKIRHFSPGQLKVITRAKLGNTVDELNYLCKQVEPFAVVMGASGKTAVQKVVFGSTTLTAIRQLTCPVVCVPPGKIYGKGIRKIGFACDFRQVAETTPAKLIKEMVKEFDAEFHILNVDYMQERFPEGTPLEVFKLHKLFTDLNLHYHFIKHPDIEEGICEFAEKNNLDLVIMIPKKHNLLDALFKPGSTRQMVFKSHIPLMCVHEQP